MKLSIILATCSYWMLIAALPESVEKREFEGLQQQCANLELSCCSNFKSSAEGTQTQSFDPSTGGVNVIGNAISVIGTSTTAPLQELIPISILSGCAPIIDTLGVAHIQCTNYIACCVPGNDPGLERENVIVNILLLILKSLILC
ncbi:hypothetical protein N7540_003245 [Penicillium herquei]|nr:hypothetical protein N7540_003245 [Penicillium herquei]